MLVNISSFWRDRLKTVLLESKQLPEGDSLNPDDIQQINGNQKHQRDRWD